MTHSDQLECSVVDREPSTIQRPMAAPLEITTLVTATARPKSPSGWRWVWGGSAVLLAIAAGAGWSAAHSSKWRGEDPIRRLPMSKVTRVDLSTVQTAFGRVESSRNTVITCELERLEIRAAGKSVSSGGASMILSLIDEGTEVKKGDLLCKLDSSDYEELVYTQELKTEQASAALKQAILSFEVAELSVREYRDGLAKQSIPIARRLDCAGQGGSRTGRRSPANGRGGCWKRDTPRSPRKRPPSAP